MCKRRHAPASLWLALIANVGQCAYAEEFGALDNFSVSVGAFVDNTSASVRVDGVTKGSGTALDLDRDLGQGGTSALPYFSASWRPWDHHEFEFTYYSDSNDGSRTLSRDIMFGGKEFVVGGQINSKFSIDASSLAYRYWAWTSDVAAFGIFGGLQWYSIRLDLSGTAGVIGPDGTVTATATASKKVSSALPDPSIGLSYRYQMADWARFVADGGGFKINVENIDATLYNARLGVEFYPWTNFGIVTQYMWNHIDANLDKTNFLGNFNADFNGFQVLFKARF